MPKFQFSRLLFLLFFACSTLSYGQRRSAEPFDVLHYQFDVQLNDTTNAVAVTAQLTILYLDSIPAQTILDLASPTDATGMLVDKLKFNEQTINYTHDADQLKLATPATVQIGDTVRVSISYSGIPDMGLVFGQTAQGDRTIFAEHWPNRAHRWLPVIDHPSEKATCEFVVTAPGQYQVVSNGDLQNEQILADGLKQTHWKMSQPIPAKVMVIGVAEFVKRSLDNEKNITAWTYKNAGSAPQEDLADAPAIYGVLRDFLGEYPFTKCDQVESTTRFGGMENAGNIFYPEKNMTGEHRMNPVIAHEIAHQWFGNSVSESDWTDVWVSEGFATFLEYYWINEALGKDSLQAKLDIDEIKIRDYQRLNPDQIVVQMNIDNLEDILNALTYEKAGWVLRMLYQKVGKETFRQIVLTFYEKYKFKNASTQDFIKVAEEISMLDLKPFFQQWFYTPDMPRVNYKWKYKKDRLVIDFEQLTSKVFLLDLDVQVKFQNMNFEIKRVVLNQRAQTIEIPCENPDDVVLDPLNIVLGYFYEK
ncbi:M1 family metallopeptidase [Reichenbachiella carrageenanivorans]|uniref:Aminopeptidase N n=1 Tax=Reichenbachiella carrageenanivorans TaxID=2979869 RepID=A0ABY6D4V4_9BACT|nr:M1 family metallopeptidase [Reichenbachiella carrageenanivorans]UXX81190.1 M1 family metallopeptidase [Reichenbachiella carrageenanivorans]